MQVSSDSAWGLTDYFKMPVRLAKKYPLATAAVAVCALAIAVDAKACGSLELGEGVFDIFTRKKWCGRDIGSEICPNLPVIKSIVGDVSYTLTKVHDACSLVYDNGGSYLMSCMQALPNITSVDKACAGSLYLLARFKEGCYLF